MVFNPQILYNELYQSFLHSVDNSGLEKKYFRLGSEIITISFAGRKLMKYCEPAIEHIKNRKTKNSSFEISIFDSKSTNAKIPINLWKNLNNNSVGKNPSHVRNYFTDGNIKGIYHSESKAISIFNIENSHALVWYNSPDSIPFYSISSPFRSIFHWYFLEKELQLIHAGAIGYKDVGALVVGPSGSGKSNTVLSCIQSGLKFAGDDHILIDSNKTMNAFCIYNAFKLKRKDIPRHKNLLGTEVAIENDNYEKSIFLMNTIDSKNILKSFKIKAIIITAVTSNKLSKLIPTSSSRGLLAISPNTIFQLPGSGRREYENIVRLVKKTPIYKLELGTNMDNIYNQIDELLKIEN